MRLREIRLAKGVGQKELATKIGTDEPMMSKFENYKCLPIPAMMKKLLEELGCRRVEEIYEPHEVYLQLANFKASVRTKKGRAKVYKLTATLPKEAKDIFDKALKPLGYRSVTDWVRQCFERLEDTYREYSAKEKTPLTPASKEVKS